MSINEKIRQISINKLVSQKVRNIVNQENTEEKIPNIKEEINKIENDKTNRSNNNPKLEIMITERRDNSLKIKIKMIFFKHGK